MTRQKTGWDFICARCGKNLGYRTPSWHKQHKHCEKCRRGQGRIAAPMWAIAARIIGRCPSRSPSSAPDGTLWRWWPRSRRPWRAPRRNGAGSPAT
jgi:hypothetical protein